MPIEPDKNLLREVGQITNGRLIHDRNALSYSYEYHCKQGNQEAADRFEKRLRQLILVSKGVIQAVDHANF